MKKLTTLIAAVLVALSLSSPAWAQVSLASTTLSTAVANGSVTTISVASAGSIAAGWELYVDREAMIVTSISGTNVVVQRGYGGTSGQPHLSGAVVWNGLTSYFGVRERAGACTATDEIATPYINVVSGDIFQCTNGSWVQWSRGGLPAFTMAAGSTTAAISYTASGAITIQPGVHTLTTTTLAMTLAQPTAAQNGMILIITSGIAAGAHTVTNSTNFSGSTTLGTIATFTAGVGNSICLLAVNGNWLILYTRNVTIS